MIIHEELAREAYEVLESASKVSKLKVTPEKFVKWCNTINRWNVLPYGKVFDSEEEYSDYVIPTKLKGMIDPNWISLTGISTEKNFAKFDADYKSKYAIMSVSDFNKVTNAINGAMKWEQSRTEIQPLRNSKMTLADAAKRDMVDGKVLNTTESFIPLDTNAISFYEDEAYCKNADAMFIKWFTDTIGSNSNNQLNYGEGSLSSNENLKRY